MHLIIIAPGFSQPSASVLNHEIDNPEQEPTFLERVSAKAFEGLACLANCWSSCCLCPSHPYIEHRTRRYVCLARSIEGEPQASLADVYDENERLSTKRGYLHDYLRPPFDPQI